jgi:hypothetical protein
MIFFRANESIREEIINEIIIKEIFYHNQGKNVRTFYF